MKKLFTLIVGTVLSFVAATVLAQNAPMMNGGMRGGGWMGGYGGYWLPLLLIVVIGLVAWVVMQRRK